MHYNSIHATFTGHGCIGELLRKALCNGGERWRTKITFNYPCMMFCTQHHEDHSTFTPLECAIHHLTCFRTELANIPPSHCLFVPMPGLVCRSACYVLGSKTRETLTLYKVKMYYLSFPYVDMWSVILYMGCFIVTCIVYRTFSFNTSRQISRCVIHF